MKLAEDVRFESLGAVRDELREWLGPDADKRARAPKNKIQRDMLISVLIHHLAQEISDVRVRAQIQALLSELNLQRGKSAAE